MNLIKIWDKYST